MRDTLAIYEWVTANLCTHWGSGSQFIPLLADERPLIKFRFEDEYLLLSILAFDQKDNKILEIIDNELVYWLHGIIDANLVKRTLMIKGKTDGYSLTLEFNPPTSVVVSNGFLGWAGKTVNITPSQILLNNGMRLSGIKGGNSEIGLCLGRQPEGMRACWVHED